MLVRKRRRKDDSKLLVAIAVTMICISIAFIGMIFEKNESKTKEVKPEKEVVETIEVQEEEEIKDEIITMDNEEFKYYMTTKMSSAEYAEYFKTIEEQEVEFDGCIIDASLRSGYNTRLEMFMAAGDYISEEEWVGPFIKVNDIAKTKLGRLAFGKCNVKVKARIDQYNTELEQLEITILEIESR